MRMSHESFAKDLPGAQCLYRPPDLADYKDDPWDVRISLKNAPLDEAFYMTVEDPGASSLTIREILERYALNPELKSCLDTTDYPELPLIQDELNQYYKAMCNGQLVLDIYVNHSGKGPVALFETVDRHMGVCRYADGSYDYRVLDLIFAAKPPQLNSYEMRKMRERYRRLFMLLLIAQKGVNALVQHPDLEAYLKGRSFSDSSGLYECLRQLEREEVLHKRPGEGAGSLSTMELTEKGNAVVTELQTRVDQLVDTYDCYASVAAYPPALGVPDGFDVRVQMMERDGLDIEEMAMLWIINENRDALFADWRQALTEDKSLEQVNYVLAYRTHFTEEVLASLRALTNK